MALSAYERQVLLLNLTITMVPDDAPSWSAVQFFEAIQKIYLAGGAAAKVGESVSEEQNEAVAGDDNMIRIADLRVGDDGTRTMLFQHGDARATDPRFMHKRTAKIRSAGMTSDETLSHAAHMLVQLPTSSAKSFSVHAALERSPGLGKTTVINFLNRLIRVACADSDIRFTDETGRARRCHPKLVAAQPLSASMQADIAESRLSRIEFIRSEVTDGLDEQGVVRPVSLRLVHEVDGKLDKRQNMALLRRAKAFARSHGYDSMQVRFTRANSKNQLSPRFETDLDDAADLVYARTETINGFSDKLDQCPTAIVDEMLTKMHDLFAKPKLWK